MATLDAEKLKLLLSNHMYVDIHTVKHGPGELRDQWRPLDPAAAARLMGAFEARQQTGRGPIAAGTCHLTVRAALVGHPSAKLRSR